MDGSVKNLGSEIVKMAVTFKITNPNIEYVIAIDAEPSAFKAELVAVILVLILCDEKTCIKLHTDCESIVSTFEKHRNKTINKIVRSKINYKPWWIMLFKMLDFFKLKLEMIKVKVHDICKENNDVDKLAKDALNKETLMIDHNILLHKGSFTWKK